MESHFAQEILDTFAKQMLQKKVRYQAPLGLNLGASQCYVEASMSQIMLVVRNIC